MPDPTPNMRALFARAERVLGSPVASVAGGLAEALDEVERLRAERDRLARILAVERGDESQAPEGWRRPAGRWLGPSGSSVLRGDAPGGGQAWVAYGWEGQVLGWYPTALEAMEAADAALAELD